MAVLSASGPGTKIGVSTQLTPLTDSTGPHLQMPGSLCIVDGKKARCRSVSIAAQWSGSLSVTQTLSFERREV
ncbi:hypothetical protein CCP4SC76_2850001 [Gammaproteobacteria bacterium]